MAAWRYEVSLLLLKKYFTREIFFDTQRQISNLHAAM